MDTDFATIWHGDTTEFGRGFLGSMFTPGHCIVRRSEATFRLNASSDMSEYPLNHLRRTPSNPRSSERRSMNCCSAGSMPGIVIATEDEGRLVRSGFTSAVMMDVGLDSAYA